jgi:hypothetical protein
MAYGHSHHAASPITAHMAIPSTMALPIPLAARSAGRTLLLGNSPGASVSTLRLRKSSLVITWLPRIFWPRILRFKQFGIALRGFDNRKAGLPTM